MANPEINDETTVALKKMNDKIVNDKRVRSNLLTLGDGTVFVFKP